MATITLNPLDNIDTYRKVADNAYAQAQAASDAEKARNALRNPKAVLTEQENEAGIGPSPVQPASAPATTTRGFTKPFTPAERAKQDAQKQELLRKRGDI